MQHRTSTISPRVEMQFNTIRRYLDEFLSTGRYWFFAPRSRIQTFRAVSSANATQKRLYSNKCMSLYLSFTYYTPLRKFDTAFRTRDSPKCIFP